MEKIWLYADKMLQVSFRSSSNSLFATQLRYTTLIEETERNEWNLDENLKEVVGSVPKWCAKPCSFYWSGFGSIEKFRPQKYR